LLVGAAWPRGSTVSEVLVLLTLQPRIPTHAPSAGGVQRVPPEGLGLPAAGGAARGADVGDAQVALPGVGGRRPAGTASKKKHVAMLPVLKAFVPSKGAFVSLPSELLGLATGKRHRCGRRSRLQRSRSCTRSDMQQHCASWQGWPDCPAPPRNLNPT
jgi:hypothetical protein